MKTLLFIGVLIAVISWSSALQCWGKMFGALPAECEFAGKTVDQKACEKVDCPTNCGRTTVELDGHIHTSLGCTALPAADCTTVESETKRGKKMTGELTTCSCNTKLCNGADGTSYIHLIIAVIVGAIFFS